MRGAAAILVGCALLVAALLAFAPATLVDPRLAAATAGRLRIAEAAGTVWDGRGVLTDAGGTWRVPVAWSVRVPALARGVLDVTLAPLPGAPPARGRIELDASGATLHDVAVELPASALAAALPGRLGVAVGGRVALTAPAFAWTGGRGTGDIAARWQDARIAVGGTTADLGTVDLKLAPQDGRLGGPLTGSGGDVRLEGTVSIAQQSIAVDGTATPAPSAPPAVARALAALGAPDGNGAVRIAWRGNLR